MNSSAPNPVPRIPRTIRRERKQKEGKVSAMEAGFVGIGDQMGHKRRGMRGKEGMWGCFPT